MNITECRLCRSEASFLFEGKVLDLDIKYYECKRCGYVFTEEPYWLDRAYSEVMNLTDTGIMARNLANVRKCLVTLFLLGKLDKKVVDFAGGYGILVRMLRDSGIDAYWADPYAENYLARGFEYNNNDKAYLVTAFEAFEHFVNPKEEIDRLFKIAPNILFSTNLIPKPAPEHNEWWYYGREHGQHVGLFREETLRYIAQKRNKYLVTNGTSYHLLTDRPINAKIWNLALRGSKPLAFFLKQFLDPKTWSDHLDMKDKI
jgi:hypothetical protein